MYKFNRGLDNIYSYQAQNNQLIYLKKDSSSSELFLNDNRIIEENVKSFISNSEYIVFTTTKQKVFIYNILENTLNLLFENHAVGEIFFSDYRIDLYRWNDDNFSNYDRLFYDYLNRKIIFENSIIPTREVNGGLLFEQLTHTTLKSINFETGTYHWEVDLGVYINSVLGVFANKLWIYTGTNELISLALNTGQILQRIRSHDFHPNVSDSGFVAFAVHFEEEQGRITFLEHRTYVEFDLASCQVIRQKSFDTGNPQADWAFSVNSLDDDYCYFVGNQGRDAGFAQWVGVLNRTTLEVEWSEHLGKQNPRNYWALNKAPLSDGNKLYVHDSEGTLHIFEKTEDN